MLFEIDTLLLVGAGILCVLAVAFAVRPYVIRRAPRNPQGPSTR